MGKLQRLPKMEASISVSFFFSFDDAVRNGGGGNTAADWVEEKMFCHHCDDSLAGHRYVLRDDHPYCIKCYENVFANNCDECGKLIGIDSKVSMISKLHLYCINYIETV